jgi:hypothetical protein
MSPKGDLFPAATVTTTIVRARLRSDFVGREPERQDALDLMRAGSALAYWTAFVSGDVHLR